MAVLGSILIDNTVYNKVSPYLSKDYFYDGRNQRLWSVIGDMIKNNEPTDYISIIANLTDLDKENGVTAYYLTGLNDYASVELAEHHAKRIYEKKLLRDVIGKSREIADASFTNNRDVYEILNDTHTSIGQLIAHKPSAEFSITDSMDEVMESVVEGDSNLVKTGFEGFDELCGGMTRGEITVIGGRPGHGKTTTMINMVKSCVDKGLKVIVFNREMTNVEMLKKLLVLESGKLSYLNVRRGFIGDIQTSEELNRIKKVCNEKYNKNAFQMYDNLKNFAEASGKVKRFKPDIVFDDYIQLIVPDNPKLDRRFQIEKICSDYKWLAKSENCAAVLVSQLNRALETRDKHRPRMSDLAESGTIEQIAENVIFSFYPYKIYMGEKESPNVIELIGSKVRYGVSGVSKLGYDGDKCKLFQNEVEFRRSKLG